LAWEKFKTFNEAGLTTEQAIEAVKESLQSQSSGNNDAATKPSTTGNTSTNVRIKYKKGTILHTDIGNVRVDSDSTRSCCQDDKKATDTVPSLKKKKD
jgi:hypothetical protein